MNIYFCPVCGYKFKYNFALVLNRHPDYTVRCPNKACSSEIVPLALKGVTNDNSRRQGDATTS